MLDLPSGNVTFLFTDIEGSTRLLQQLGDRYLSPPRHECAGVPVVHPTLPVGTDASTGSSWG